ncbi:GGDEF domain-containing protein [Microbulbifer bruguierae]|uniref:diguanylate cyclase n=1 Tax=Microbulbifer bruguierae TaxID=3029061 RepID=A0ABY8N812_9GAMM|nr:GGDEF domain-containing protein [Microbulbifer bruguierae]WGL15036.1 GGDEF domain-containing protein [Microbulbifer bruguierae]
MTALHYIYITMLLTSAMLCSIFLIAWITIERKLHTILWSILYGVSIVNMLMNATKDWMPNPEIYWMLVNATSLIVQGLAISGYRNRAGLNPLPRSILGYLLLVEVSIGYFTLVNHHMGLRVALTPLSSVVMSTLCIHALYHNSKFSRPAEKATAIIFAIYAATQITTAFFGLMQGAERDEYWLNLYSQVNFMAMPAAYSGIGLFTVLLIADDLSTRMRRLATTDQLTGLLNRRGFFEAAELYIQRNLRADNRVYLTITDIDYFKKINDRYGHIAGDIALRRISAVIADKLPQDSIAARMGGEEFTLLFRAPNLDIARKRLLQLKDAIETTTVSGKQWHFRMTASFGLVSVSQDPDAIDQAIAKADSLLYQAKALGRNCIVDEAAGATAEKNGSGAGMASRAAARQTQTKKAAFI